MCEETLIRAFVFTLDVVHPAFGIQDFIDYAKTNSKKTFIPINANDYLESSGRSFKGGKKHQTHSIVKGISGKIETEISKVRDHKKKIQMMLEKKQTRGNSSLAATRVTEENQLYEGKADIVFCIIGFPYVPKQLKRMCKVINISAFIAVHKQSNEINKEEPIIRRSKQISKKTFIKGSELDSIFNANTFPPLRWNSLQSTCDPSIVFSEIENVATTNEAWKSLQHYISLITDCRNRYFNSIGNSTFHIIPQILQCMADLEEFHKQNDESPIKNMLCYLQSNNWETVSVRSKPSPIDKIFLNGRSNLHKTYIYTNTGKPFTYYNKVAEQYYWILYPIVKWKLKEENYKISKLLFKFYHDFENFRASAGHRYELMISNLNKKMKLGYPSNFNEWKLFQYTIEYKHITEALKEIDKDNYIFDTFLEEPAGVLWILVIPSITRFVGRPKVTFFMPPTSEGATDFMSMKEPEKTENDKKQRNFVLTTNFDVDQIFPSFLKQLETEKHFYKLPMKYNKTIEYNYPYYIENGIRVNIKRSIINELYSFSYEITLKNKKIQSTKDSINVYIKDPKMNLYFKENDFTILINNFSLVYNFINLNLTSNNKKYIISNGNFICEINEIKIIITKKGEIGKYDQNKWIWIDLNGDTCIKGTNNLEYTKTKQILVKNFDTKTKQIIRDDEYIHIYINKDESRTIIITDNIKIHQYKNYCTYEIYNFPIITYKSNEYIFSFNKYKFVLDKQKISVNDSLIEYKNKIIDMNLKNDKTLSLTFDCCQIKSNEKIFFANKSGVQSFGILANLNPKRKTNFVESKWGKIQPFKDTMNEQQMNLILSDLTPRFFAVRSDLSSTEFVHENFFMNKTRNLTQKNKEFILLNQKFNIITTHDIKTLNNNKAYLKHDFIDKITRNNILRKLQIPKSSSRRKRNLDEAKEDVNQILSDQIEFNLFFHDLREKIQQIMKENEKVYLEEINPKVEPPEIIRVPVLTPEPRLQIAQSQMNFVKRNKPLNYWLSPESEFVVLPECKKCLPKPIPKSAKLYDMPDPNVRMDKPPKDPVSFRPTKMIISPRRPADLGFYKTEVSRPQTTSKQDYVDFGDVKLGKKAHAQFILTNIGKAPLKYSFSKPKNTSVRVLTVPGIVAPGLKLKIKLEIEPKKIGEIDTYFLLISNQGEMKIPVYGNVIK